MNIAWCIAQLEQMADVLFIKTARQLNHVLSILIQNCLKRRLCTQSCNCESCYDNGIVFIVGLIGVLLLAELTASSARCWNIDTWLCCLLTLWSFCVETCIQSFICEVFVVNLELLFPILNIYLFL
jgi:hypothetical protein